MKFLHYLFFAATILFPLAAQANTIDQVCEILACGDDAVHRAAVELAVNKKGFFVSTTHNGVCRRLKITNPSYTCKKKQQQQIGCVLGTLNDAKFCEQSSTSGTVIASSKTEPTIEDPTNAESGATIPSNGYVRVSYAFIDTATGKPVNAFGTPSWDTLNSRGLGTWLKHLILKEERDAAVFLRIYEGRTALIDHPVFFWSKNDKFKKSAQTYQIDYNGYLGGYQKVDKPIHFGIVVKANNSTIANTQELAGLISNLNAIRAGRLSEFKLKDTSADNPDDPKVDEVNSVVDYEAFRKHFSDVDKRIGSFASEYNTDQRWTLSRKNKNHYSTILYNFDGMQARSGLPGMAIEIKLEYASSLLADESVSNVPNTKIYIGDSDVRTMNEYIKADPKTEDEWHNLGSSQNNLIKACKSANSILKARMEPVDQFIAISGLLHDRSTEVENVGWSQELEEKCFTKADLQEVKDQFPDIYKKFRFPYVDANPGYVLLYTTEDVTKNRPAYKAGLAAKNDVLNYVNKLLKTAAEDKLNTDNELVIESLISSTNDSLFAGYPHELELCDDTGVLRRRSGFQAKCVDLGAGEFMNQLVQGKPSLSKDSGGLLVGTGCYFHFRPRTANDGESVLSDKNGNVATPNASQSMAFISGKLVQLDWSFQSFRGKPVLSKLVLTEMDKASEDHFRKFKGEGCSASFTRIIAARDSHQRKIAANNANNPDAG